MNKIKLTIAIPSLPSRIEKHLLPLWDKLNKQIKNEKDIEVITLMDNKNMSVGQKRTRLFGMAKGRYTCLIDDDDDVTKDFIEIMREKITDDLDVDVICYHQLASLINKPWIIKTSLEYDKIHPYEQAQIDIEGNPMPCHRPPWHWCAWKTEFAKKIPFGDSNTQEDTLFVIQAAEQAKTQLVIDRIMCRYNWSAEESQAHFESIDPLTVKKAQIEF
jgi:hypothetical protein